MSGLLWIPAAVGLALGAVDLAFGLAGSTRAGWPAHVELLGAAVLAHAAIAALVVLVSGPCPTTVRARVLGAGLAAQTALELGVGLVRTPRPWAPPEDVAWVAPWIAVLAGLAWTLTPRDLPRARVERVVAAASGSLIVVGGAVAWILASGRGPAGVLLAASAAALGLAASVRLAGALVPVLGTAGNLTVVSLALVAWLGRADAADVAPLGPRPSTEAPATVLVLVIDTLRADALSCLNPDGPATPNLDAIAAESRVYTAARAPSSWTLPSTVSILTGAHPRVHGVVDATTALPRQIPSLAERLRTAGYRTAAFGENGWLSPSSGLARGFERYDLFPRQLARLPFARLFVQALAPERLRGDLPAPDLHRRALSWLSEIGDEPAFLWLHYFDVHQPYTPAPAFRPDGPPPDGMTFAFDDFRAVREGHFAPNREQRAWIRALYEAEVRELDAEIGRFVGALRELGRWDDALVLVVSDHGEEFWEHGGYEHGHTLFEEVLRVPLLVHRPGGADAGPDDRPVSVESAAWTVLELCGVDVADEAAPHGGTLRDATSSTVASDNLYFEDQLALRDGRWKYLRWSQSEVERVFDLDRDPFERRSLLETPEADRVPLEALRTRLGEFLGGALEARTALGVEDSARDVGGATLDRLRELGYLR